MTKDLTPCSAARRLLKTQSWRVINKRRAALLRKLASRTAAEEKELDLLQALSHSLLNLAWPVER